MNDKEILNNIEKKISDRFAWIISSKIDILMKNDHLIINSKYNDYCYFDLNFNLHKIAWSPKSFGEHWYVNNVLSRLDGPAVISRKNFYIINDCEFMVDVFAEKSNHLLCNSCENFCKQKCF